jgi:hypothetical protein
VDATVGTWWSTPRRGEATEERAADESETPVEFVRPTARGQIGTLATSWPTRST